MIIDPCLLVPVLISTFRTNFRVADGSPFKTTFVAISFFSHFTPFFSILAFFFSLEVQVLHLSFPFSSFPSHNQIYYSFLITPLKEGEYSKPLPMEVRHEKTSISICIPPDKNICTIALWTTDNFTDKPIKSTICTVNIKKFYLRWCNQYMFHLITLQ